MINELKVALIVNCHNSERYLRQTLDSLCGQTWDNFVLLCIENCSTDSTAEILEEYAKRYKCIEVYYTSRLFTLVEARVYAIEILARKPGFTHFAFCDSDDVWESEWLEKALSVAKEYDLVFCNGWQLYEESGIYRSIEHCIVKKRRDAFSSPLFLQSVLFSTDLINDAEKLDLSLPMLYDMDLLLRLLIKGVSYIHISDKCFVYRVHADSLSSTRRWDVTKERYRITRKHNMSVINYLLKSVIYLTGLRALLRRYGL